MKAIRVHQFGGPDVMRLEQLEPPNPGQGEVVVRVVAAGVGPWDGWVRGGHSVLPQPLPLTPGADLSGVVHAVGQGVDDLAVGDEVFGVTNSRFTDAYAELALASAAMLAKKPTSLTHVQAASVPVIAVTAWQMLFEHAALRAGQTVLVHGAAGNVGAYAVQLAHLRGIRVIATASRDDLAEVARLGADQTVDYRAARFEDVVGTVDAVIDTVGGELQRRSFAVLARGGVLVTAVSEPDQELAAKHGVRALFMLVRVTSQALHELTALFETGKLEVRVGAVVPLRDAVLAHEMLEGIRPRVGGKIVLQVAE
jgi:NADPH:quinone reductase-like Zn-dependent oxidoreductase